MGRLSELLAVRVTPELVARVEREADRLGLRPADVARTYLAKALADAEGDARREPAEAGTDDSDRKP